MARVWILSAGSISVVAAAAAVTLTAVMRLATVAVPPSSAWLLTTVMVVLRRTGQVRARGCGLHLMSLMLTGLVAPFVS
jgi:hypothetical protein